MRYVLIGKVVLLRLVRFADVWERGKDFPMREERGIVMKLYHATSKKKAKIYRETGHIVKPVRGFTTLQAAMMWSLSIEGDRPVFLEINCNETIPESKIHKLPDHHNEFGEAWWIDENVECSNYKCVLSCK